MTRAAYIHATERREHARQLLKPEGVTLQQIATAMGYANVSNASNIMSTLEFAGLAFKCRAKIKTDMRPQASETIYFPTQADLDAFNAAHREAKRLQDIARKKSKGYRTEYYAKRNEQRRLARQARVQAAYAEKAQREALKLAEAEQRKQRARLEREAKAAAKDREKREAESQRRALKAMTKAAGKLGKQKGTASPAPAKPRGPAFVGGELDLSRARITIAPKPRSRYEVESAPSVISSRECRAWAQAAAA